jgi:hypothetical protein
MTDNLVMLMGKRFAIFVGLSLVSTVIFAESTQLDVISDPGSAVIKMQRVVVPPPSGPYASRLGMPAHERRIKHRMMAPANRPSSVNNQAAENITAPANGHANYGTYRPEVPRRSEMTAQPTPVYGNRNRGYAPAYYPRPPRGYGYPPVPPPGYATRWGGRQ